VLLFGCIILSFGLFGSLEYAFYSAEIFPYLFKASPKLIGFAAVSTAIFYQIIRLALVLAGANEVSKNEAQKGFFSIVFGVGMTIVGCVEIGHMLESWSIPDEVKPPTEFIMYSLVIIGSVLEIRLLMNWSSIIAEWRNKHQSDTENDPDKVDKATISALKMMAETKDKNPQEIEKEANQDTSRIVKRPELELEKKEI
jgi:hypothetical protein